MKILQRFTLLLVVAVGSENFAEPTKNKSRKVIDDASGVMNIQDSDIRGFDKTDMGRFIDDNEQGDAGLVKIRLDWKDRVLESLQYLDSEVRGSGLEDEEK